MNPNIYLAFFLGLFLALFLLFFWIFALGRKLRSAQEKARKLEWELEKSTQIHQERELLWKNSDEQLTQRFTQLAQKILEDRSKIWGESQQKQLDQILRPFHQNLFEFKKQVQDTYEKETRDRSALQKEIQILRELNQQMSQEAHSLAKAIKGSSKAQGIWGEMVLERILEISGLKKGREYETQTLYNGPEGKGMPDVVVHLPGGRDVVVDAKVSLVSYERAVREEDPVLRKGHVEQHILSLKKHVDGLSAKDYPHLEGLKTLDFVFLFVPIESALSLALEWDQSFMDFAIRKRVFLVGPSTLLAALKTIEFQWKTEKQNKGAQQIAQEAGKLLDKILRVFEDVQKIDQVFSQGQKILDTLQGRLKKGPGNVLGRIHKIKELGGENTKSLPDEEEL